MNITHVKTLACAAAAMAGLSTANAQIVVEEIVITAQKREQSLQEVPIAVSAYDGETLYRAGVKDLRDLQQLSPSLVLTSTQSEAAGTTARIRGVGTTGDNLGLESSVAVFIDGVYRNRNSVALTDLGEVERIEVLRGPQGTLFGKNASAGLIHVITKGPDLEEFSGYGEGTAGDYDEYRLGAGVNVPIIDNVVGFRLDGSWAERDGFITDITNGTDYNDRDRYMVRGQLGGLWGNDFEWRLIADYAERTENCCAAVTNSVGPTAAAINLPGNPFNGGQQLGTIIDPAQPFARKNTVTQSRGYMSDVEETGASLQFDWDIGIGTLTSITAYRDWASDRSQDLDYTDADIVYRPYPGNDPNYPGMGEVGYGNQFETLTQELRYAGTTGDVDWLFGFYYVDETLDVLDGVRMGAGYQGYVNTLLFSLGAGTFPANTFQDGQGAVLDDFQQDTTSTAVFTHNTWNVTEELGITLGLRYTDEEKKLNANLVANNPACLAAVGGAFPATGLLGIQLACVPIFSPLVDGMYAGKRSDDEWTGTLVFDYDFTDDWMGYASYSRGYKAGGYNLDRAGFNFPGPAVTDLEFDPEIVNSYEIGVKGNINSQVTLNIAAFISQFDDYQLNTFTGTNFVVSNLDEATSKGIEVESQAYITDGWTVSTGLAWTDARYGTNVGDPNLADQRLTNAPEWVATAATDYERPFGGLLGFLHVDWRFTGKHNTGSNLAPAKEQAGAAVWNGSIGIAGQNREWEVELWSRNIFDRDYRQVVFDGPLQGLDGVVPFTYYAFLGDPRTWGIRGRVSF